MVKQRLKETEKPSKSPPKEDQLMDGLSFGTESRNSKTDFNKTLGKKLANFKQLLDEEELDDREAQENKQSEGVDPLSSQKAKMNLAQELGKLKTEYDDFSPEKSSSEQQSSLKAKGGLLISATGDDIETREDADDLSDESPEPRNESLSPSLLDLKQMQPQNTGGNPTQSQLEENKEADQKDKR